MMEQLKRQKSKDKILRKSKNDLPPQPKSRKNSPEGSPMAKRGLKNQILFKG